MCDDIDDGNEVETLLLALARLLRSGCARARREGDDNPDPIIGRASPRAPPTG